MSYTAQNIQIFTAAFSGALAGMGLSDRIIKDQSSASYAGLASVAGAWAQAVDTAWTSARATTLLDVEAVQSGSAAYWQDRSPIPDSTNTAAVTHAAGALALIASITASEAYYAAQGLIPPAIPGGSTTGGFPNVANLAALGAINWVTNGYANGYQYYVHTQRSFWILSQTGTETVNGNTVIAATGGGRWLRSTGFAHPSWALVGNWYIDPTNGNDEYNGQAQAPAAGNVGPVKTWGEIQRRIGTNVLTPPASATVPNWNECIVNVLATLPDSDPINIPFTIASSSALRITGVLGKTQLYSGAFSAVTPLNAAANQLNQCTDAGIGSWTTYLGKRIRITQAGTNLNATCWVAKDLGANQARVSTLGLIGLMENASSGSTFTAKTLTNGDTFVIEDFPTVTFGSINPTALVNATNFRYGSVWIGEINARDGVYINQQTAIQATRNISFYSALLPTTVDNIACFFTNCRLTNSLQSGNTNTITIIIAGIFSGFNPGAATGTGTMAFCQVPLFQGVILAGNNIQITSVAICDSTTHGIVVGQLGSSVTTGGFISVCTSPIGSDIADRTVLGSGNTGVGVFVTGGSTFRYSAGATFKITGTAGDFKLSTGTQSFAWNPATQAYTAAINNTWTLLATTIGGGGYGNSAHNPADDAHLVQAPTN